MLAVVPTHVKRVMVLVVVPGFESYRCRWRAIDDVQGWLQNLTVCVEHIAVAKRACNNNGEASKPMLVIVAWTSFSERAEHPLGTREVVGLNLARSLLQLRRGCCLCWQNVILAIWVSAMELSYGDAEAPNQFPK